MAKFLCFLETGKKDPSRLIEIMRLLLLLTLLCIHAFVANAQCDLTTTHRNGPIRAKKAVVTNPVPWSSSRPRLSRSMIVGGDRRGAFRRKAEPQSGAQIYDVSQVQMGRIVTCSFVGFYQGRIDMLGGGIQHQNAQTMAAAVVIPCVILPYRNGKTRRDGKLKSFLSELFVYSVSYSVGLGIGRALTPNYGSL